MDSHPELLARIEKLCLKLQEASARYRNASNENQVFEVKRKILADIRELEHELEKLKELAKSVKP